MRLILEILREQYSAYTMAIIVGCGLFVYFIEQKERIKKKLYKEAKIAKISGLTYILGGIILYVIALFVR